MVLIQVNKTSKRIEGYVDSCYGVPLAKEGCVLIEVEKIPNDWYFCRYENNQIIFDDEYKKEKVKEKELLEIRMRREAECFPFINRGSLWYGFLTETQKQELQEWYQAWLNATETHEIPKKPNWLK